MPKIRNILITYLSTTFIFPLQRPTCGGGEQPSREMPGEAMPSGVKAIGREPPRALRKMETWKAG